MQYLPNGVVVFNTIQDLYYDLLIELGLAIKDEFVYVQDTGVFLRYDDKFIKASVDGRPVYPNRNAVVFDLSINRDLTEKIFGYYLDSCQADEEEDTIGGYIAHYTEYNDEREKQRVVVKSVNRGEIRSNFYYNIYLSYIDCIFKIAGYNVDLSNFDVVPEIIIGGKKSR